MIRRRLFNFRQKCFTLNELLITIALVAVIVGLLPFLGGVSRPSLREAFMLWAFAATLVTLVVLRAIRLRRERRLHRPPHCATCTYDLTGNTSGVCPECGTVVAGKAKLTT